MHGSRLKGKTTLITGGASGLGLAIAKRFAEESAKVIITDIDSDAGAAAAARFNITFLPHDVTVESQWEALMAKLAADKSCLDVLVNNAGLADAGLGTALEDIDIEQSQRIFKVNFDGTLLGCKHAIRAMKATGGSIINMSSIGALVPVPFIAPYGASKAAVRHLTQSVALYCAQQGYKIRCNSIHPGQIRTGMHDDLVAATAAQHAITPEAAEEQFRSLIPMGAFGEAEDVANAALYLASNESRHVTGDRMLVDGGMMLSN
jgi:3(or 17)beta-hydroxysteroid dehydrogenase